MSGKRDAPTPETVWKEYNAGVDFKSQIDLYETVRNNENFYIGKQWEGVKSNGLPTPVFNFIKRIILFLVASTSTDNIKMAASPLTPVAGGLDTDAVCSVLNDQFDALFEHNKIGSLIRNFMRNAAVDGDGCYYCWFDPEAETGQSARGTIRVELLENTRVVFGNPNTRAVQSQPYILVARREMLEDVRREAERYGQDPDAVRPDSDETNDRFDAMTDGKATTLLRLWKEGGTLRCVKTVKDAVVRPAWDTGQRLYPIGWLNWDYVPNCYHGQAAVTGLIPNQIFINKMFAMTMISLMTTAYPKIVYDKVRIPKWDSGVGRAIGVNLGAGSIGDLVKTIDPAVISPQVSQFIELAISLTKEFMGATDAALGNVKPDNTSAIIALQKSSSVPLEIVRQDMFQCVEDMGNIWMDLMRVYYGVRYVRLDGMDAPAPFDFSVLEQMPLSIKLDVGGSAYWSEIAQINTLDNLLTQGKISVIDYLERVPNGYISDQQQLIETLKEREAAALGAAGPAMTGYEGQTSPVV